ncbi:DUF983 domain-containing protein [Neolewinella antarctica]|uniref:Uncharacterized protein (DUF983 family) n=1 Tax=Neolewinella antarctica TaxID=442734 RepID=A0ABX0X7G2_9BACT|nr:DUF983 domain-containing protein [Neolewinella antarctica]NJC25136.1 uncharacterized protein (DUF983 family) [Neolewinella antarctica]
MASNPSLLSSVFGLRCPRCRRGDLFPTSSFSFSMPFKQYAHCPKCGQNYFPEPGFYWGAMFISYIGSGFFSLGFVMMTHWVFDLGLGLSMVLLLIVVGLFFVWWFRFSRSVYFHLVTKYQPKVTEAIDSGNVTKSIPKIVSGS